MTGSSRGPQQARSRLTRRRVLEAAVDCLAEQGWAAVSVVTVAERAGVSRGAAQHHFPTREALLAAAFRHTATERLARVRRDAVLPTASPDRTEAVLVMLSDLYLGPLFRAALHLHTAAAGDDALRAFVARSEAEVNAEVHRTAVALLGVDESRPGVRELVQGTLDLLRGLGLADVLTDDGRRRGAVLHRWAELLDAALGPGRPAEPASGPATPAG